VDSDVSAIVLEGILENTDANQITSAGDLVKLTAGGDSVPTFAEVSETDTEADGFAVHNLKQRQYKTKDFIGVVGDGGHIYGIAGEDVECGDKLVYDATVETPANTGKIFINDGSGSAGKIPVGKALTRAKEGQLVKILIKLEKITPTGVSGTADDSNTLTIVEGVITNIE
jgi:hypothetical protein